MRTEALPDADQITDEDLEGLEKVLEANTGAAELTRVKLDKAD